MFSKKILLLTSAALALGVSVSACSGDDDDDGTYTLSSGDYGFDVTDAPVNTCWPAGNELPLPLTSLAFTVEVVSSNGTFQIVMPDAVSAFFPNIEGTITGNDLAADGEANGIPIGTVSSNCTLNISAVGVGELTGNDEFNVNLTANLTVPTTSAAGCAQFVDTGIPLEIPIPWPTLTATSSGTCSLEIVAVAVIEPE